MNKKILLGSLIALSFMVSAFGGEAEAKKLSAELPLVHWYTCELWGEVRRGKMGFSTGKTSKAYSLQVKTKFTKLDERPAATELWKFYLYDQEDEGKEQEKGWVFVLRFDGKDWSEVSVIQNTGRSAFDMLRTDFLTPPMRPHIKQALQLYNSNKLAETVAKLERKKAEQGSGGNG